MSAQEVAQAILDGEADDELSAVNNALRDRYDYLNRQAKNAFRLGDHVRFTAEARHYAGQTGIVDRKMVKNILVKLDGDDIVNVRTSPALLELIEDRDNFPADVT